MNNNKYKIIGLIFWVAHLCHGQFFYTDYQIGEEWLKTNAGNFNDYSDSSSLWYNYLVEKGQMNDNQLFGIYFHLNNGDKTKSIYQKSDLIGDGLLTNYQYKSDKIELANSMFFTDEKYNAERGFIRTIKDVTMYTNLAYIKIFNKINELNIQTTIGRNFLEISPGTENRLLLSNYSRPFDQFSLIAKSSKWRGLFSIIQLDTVNQSNRYLYLHTLSYNQDNFSITIGEAILDSGLGKSINLNYINPFHLWSWENISGGDRGVNGFLFFGFTWFPFNTSRVYGELLIDDINFHKKNAFYLNRYGYLIGFHKTGYPMKYSNINFELTSIMHQVYQSYHITHAYTHRGFPIGHFLGNDFINFKLLYSQLLKKGKLRPFVEFSYLEDGYNGIDTPFDNPYEDHNGIVIDFKPPGHPTRPITKFYEVDFGFEINLYFQTYLTVSGQLQSKSLTDDLIENYGMKIRFWSYLDLKELSRFYN